MENRSEHPIEVNASKQDDKQEILENGMKDVNENETCTQKTCILLVKSHVPDNVHIKYTCYRQSPVCIW